MPLITLKRYLSQSDSNAGYRKLIATLMDSITSQTVFATPEDRSAFLNEMKAVRARIDSVSGMDELFAAVGAAGQLLESHNARTSVKIQKQNAELQNVISMLTQSIITVSKASGRSTDALADIRQELEHAVRIDDVHQLKVRMSVCLEKLCTESSRQNEELEALVGELQRSVREASTNAGSTGLDALTGLPLEPAAKLAFEEALKRPGRTFIVTMVVSRLQSINARFGKAVGDQVLKAWQKYIETEVLRPGDRLFRWSGPTLVALIPQSGTIDQVRSRLRPFLDRRIEEEFDVGRRTALIPLSVAWSAIALIPPASKVPLFIDKFVAAQFPKDDL